MKSTLFAADISEKDLELMGITAFGYISTLEIVFSQEVRRICEGNQCRNYGKTWACPPAVGTFEEYRAEISGYSSAFVFASVYRLENSFDLKGMMQGHRQFKDVCDRLHERLSGPCLLLSNEGCIRCRTCTYPDAPCRFPDRLFPSLEGYGILVNKLAEAAGISYQAGANTVTYFGIVCYHKEPHADAVPCAK